MSELTVYGHGLWYVTRDERTLVRLDLALESLFPGRPDSGTQDVLVYGAERAVMRALLQHALSMLDRADAQRSAERPTDV